MNPLNIALPATVAIAVALIAAQAAYIKHQTAEQGRLKTELAATQHTLQNERSAHQAYRAAAEQMQAELTRQNRAHTAAVNKLTAALQQNHTWSSQTLPADVQTALEQTK
ncbi:MAG: hypothetical protein Q4D82_02440 [Neisseria sp.]|nr:hypothetical protein [Neisseria sp.]